MNKINSCFIKFCKITLIIVIFNIGYLQRVHCQFSSLGVQMKNYGNTNSKTSNSGATGGPTTNGGSGEVVGPRALPLGAAEPTCEELRAMWRFSKRQSRAAEITNEIPTYRDPFTYNVWEPYYPTTRSLGGVRMLPRYRDSNRPVFGRVLTREPLRPSSYLQAIRNHPYDSNVRYYGSETRTAGDPYQRRFQFRSGGGGGGPANLNALSHRGKFNQLKEVVLTERAKELAAQRKSEEMVARAAALKDIANGQSIFNHRPQSQFSYSPLMDENRSPDHEQMQMDDSSMHDKFLAGQTKSTIGQRSLFSGNPSSDSGRKSGTVFLPSKISGNSKQLTEDFLPEGQVKPSRPSHFRERNRALFRQSGTPADFYQRDTRNPINSPENLNYDSINEMIDNTGDDNINNLLNDINSNENNNEEDKMINLDDIQKLYEQTKKQLHDDYLKYIFYNNNNNNNNNNYNNN